MDLSEIEYRAAEMNRRLQTRGPEPVWCDETALRIAMDDVAALVAEVVRLEGIIRRNADADANAEHWPPDGGLI